MSKRVYIETTVASYLTARPSRDVRVAGHQAATRKLWPKFGSTYEAYVSALVYAEAGRGDPIKARKRLEVLEPFRMLEVDEEARELAQKPIDGKGIPKEYPEDALHIAIAAVNAIDVIVTWNFAHLNNPFTRVKVRAVVENAGYSCPEICSPQELLEVDQ